MKARIVIILTLIAFLVSGSYFSFRFYDEVMHKSPTLISMMQTVAPGLLPKEKIMENLQSERADLLGKTLWALKKRKDDYARPNALSLLESEKPLVWESASLYLAALGDAEATPYLIKSLNTLRLRELLLDKKYEKEEQKMSEIPFPISLFFASPQKKRLKEAEQIEEDASHVEELLSELTGQSELTGYESWRDWWVSENPDHAIDWDAHLDIGFKNKTDGVRALAELRAEMADAEAAESPSAEQPEAAEAEEAAAP